MWMSPAAATFLCAIAGTCAVFLLFTFLLQYFSRTRATRTHAHRGRERERDGGRERERMAGVRFLLGPRPNLRFLPRPLDVLVEQIFRRPRSSFAEEQTPPRSRSRKAATRWNGGTANRFKRNRHLDIARMYYENVGRQFNRSGNIC